MRLPRPFLKPARNDKLSGGAAIALGDRDLGAIDAAAGAVTAGFSFSCTIVTYQNLSAPDLASDVVEGHFQIAMTASI
jgi:hypothetical protein